MNNFGYKQINNELVDNSDYTKTFTHSINIPKKIIFLEKHFLPQFFKELYMNGIYLLGRKKPILNKNITYLDENGTIINVYTIENLDNVFKENDVIFTDTFQKVLTKNDYVNNRMLFSEICTYPIFTENFIKFITSDYMRNINNEKNLVDNDLFGISHHIHLLNNDYLNNNINDFFQSYGIEDNVKYKLILENYELLYMDIINISSKLNPLSLDITINNNHISLHYYDPPSSRRYNINKILTSTDDISVYEDF